MDKLIKLISYILCFALFLGAAWVSSMGYRQVMLARSETVADPGTWLPRKEIDQLMRYHGADVLKITPDAVFIHRNSQWIPVLWRDRG